MATKKAPAKQTVKKLVKKSAPVAVKSKPAPEKKPVPAQKVVIVKKIPAKVTFKKAVSKPVKVVAKKGNSNKIKNCNEANRKSG